VNLENQSKSRWLKLLEIFERALVPREPISVVRVSNYRASFLKNYIKFGPLMCAFLLAGITGWAVYSGTSSIWITISVSVLFGFVGYGGVWVGIWLAKKLFINYIPSFQNIMEPEKTIIKEVKSYKGLRIYWAIIGIVDAFFVTGVLYHFRGLLGLIMSILIYLPSLVIMAWVLERQMENRPFIPTRISYRIAIVAAFIIVMIFLLWFMLEIGNDFWGKPGMGIAATVFVGLYLFSFWLKNKQQRERKLSS
jgi:hypothetical protein